MAKKNLCFKPQKISKNCVKIISFKALKPLFFSSFADFIHLLLNGILIP